MILKRAVSIHALNRSSLHLSAYNGIEANMSSSQFDYCLGLVRKHDFEGYLATLVLNTEARAIAVPVRAFNVEIAQVAAVVSDLKVGSMRMQFWKDNLTEMYDRGHSKAQPVAEELLKAIIKYKLPKRYLSSLIAARESNLASKSFPTYDNMDKYSEETISAVLHLIASPHMNDEAVSRSVAEACVACGVTCGTVQLLRSVPYHARHARCPLPLDALDRHGLDAQQVVSLFRPRLASAVPAESKRALCLVVRDMVDHASESAKRTRSICRWLPRRVKQIFLPQVSAENFITRLSKSAWDISDRNLLTRNNLLPAHIWWRSVFGL